jgi:hypothetical protein
MAETLGMLCDKLTIVKLKQFHTEDGEKLKSLERQAFQLQNEIDQYITGAVSGSIPAEKLTFASNKVFKPEGNETRDFAGKVGDVVAQLADINCRLWHEQEKVYDFEKVPVTQKNSVVKQLAILNLERNKCIDSINQQFQQLLTKENKA